MVVTIRVSPDTYDLLKELKERRGAKSFNKLLKSLAERELGKKRRRVVIREEVPAKGEDLILESCPHCGAKLLGNNMGVELHNIHIPIPRIGIEIQYLGCPFCERPLTSKIEWRKIEKFKIP